VKKGRTEASQTNDTEPSPSSGDCEVAAGTGPGLKSQELDFASEIVSTQFMKDLNLHGGQSASYNAYGSLAKWMAKIGSRKGLLKKDRIRTG
jgi:hypothetical protein